MNNNEKLEKINLSIMRFLQGPFYKQFLATHSTLSFSLYQELLKEEKYQSPLRLEKFGFKGKSQFDEDGIIQEIFNRIGVGSKTFIEIGVGDGTENNTVYLLANGWNGTWFEKDPARTEFIEKLFESAITPGTLNIVREFIDVQNADKLLSQCAGDKEIDLFSLDIDGNDYHVWKSIESVKPRVVCIEYNAVFAPPSRWIMKYNPKHTTTKTDYMGASLQSMYELGLKKGYKLVCCSMTGGNAFFVREDLIQDNFEPPYTPENYYQPGRYWLARGYYQGMPSSFGPTDNVEV